MANRRGLGAAGAVAAGALLAATLLAGSASAAPPERPSAEATYTVTGEPPDDPAAPDITKITVANDDLGFVTFRFEVANRTELLPSMVYGVALNTDSDLQTGGPNSDGADYFIAVTSSGIGLTKWNGSAWDASVPQSTLAKLSADGKRFRVNISDLGGVQSFRFYAIAADGNARDYAPDMWGGEFRYTVRIAKPVTKTAAAAHGKKKPRKRRT